MVSPFRAVAETLVERFLDELEADGVGRGNQVNILRTLKAIPRDAYDKGAMAGDPVKGVQKPEYVRQRVVIPDLAYLKQALAVACDDLALEIVMMEGCGLRNGEARAVNVNNVVAVYMYWVHEQIHSNTHRPAKLKHRKVGGPGGSAAPLGTGGARTLRGEARHDEEGVSAAGAERVLHGADGPSARPRTFREAARSGRDGDVWLPAISPPTRSVSGIPITDVAEWMGHKSIEETYRTHRHLMPGSITKAARILDAGLWDAG